ncbi:hypothetical protein J6590_022868 [Homalodisca vitripennis]|nr:hypothetical protein J6590_022868 [Homalodisca vitripennis]
MSARSTTQSASGSVRGSIKFAGEEAKDKMYEPKHKKKVVRVLTVIAYVFSVSLAAIMLSMYYIFIWQGTKPNQQNHHNHLQHSAAVGSVPECRVPDIHTFQEQKQSSLQTITTGQVAGEAGTRGGMSHGQNLAQIPLYNESQMAETPRALPAQEILPSTTPLAKLARQYLEMRQHPLSQPEEPYLEQDDNYTLPVPIYS